MKFDRIPVDGSTHFEDDLMNTIEPFNYDEMVDYNHAYLSGFLAEKYDVDSSKGEEVAKKRAEETIKNTFLESIKGYASTVIKNSNINNTIDNIEYVLLPVWMVNVKYKDKYYTFAMNAQTGEFIGDIPISKERAILFGIGIFLVIALIVLFISFLVYKGGM